MARVAICRSLNRWPFPNEPERMTFAQLVLYKEALAMLDGEKKPTSRRQPKRLRGEAKKVMMERVKSDLRLLNGNQ